MSKNGKLKKAQKVEKRRIQMEEALECLPLKQAVETQRITVVKNQPTLTVVRNQPAITVIKKQPKQCSFLHCLRYVDSSCTVCPYCGHALPE